MTRASAVGMLFWFHDRDKWNREHLQEEYYVWPPFPRSDEFFTRRVQMMRHRSIT